MDRLADATAPTKPQITYMASTEAAGHTVTRPRYLPKVHRLAIAAHRLITPAYQDCSDQQVTGQDQPQPEDACSANKQPFLD